MLNATVNQLGIKKRQLEYTVDTELPMQHLSVSMYLFPATIQGCPKVFMRQ